MSRRVWEIILLLPTHPAIKRGLEQVEPDSDLDALLDTNSPQRLLYAFYIIDWLGRPARLRRYSGRKEVIFLFHEQPLGKKFKLKTSDLQNAV